MKFEDIKSDDILVFYKDIELPDGYRINGMFGLCVCVVDDDENVEYAELDDLDENIANKVREIVNNDLFEYSPNE